MYSIYLTSNNVKYLVVTEVAVSQVLAQRNDNYNPFTRPLRLGITSSGRPQVSMAD